MSQLNKGESIQNVVETGSLWKWLEAEAARMKVTPQFSVEYHEISNDKRQAYREGYIDALDEVRRSVYALERGTLEAGWTPTPSHSDWSPAESRGEIQPIERALEVAPFRRALDEAEAHAKATSRFGVEDHEIHEYKREAYREGYIDSLSEVGFTVRGLEKAPLRTLEINGPQRRDAAEQSVGFSPDERLGMIQKTAGRVSELAGAGEIDRAKGLLERIIQLAKTVKQELSKAKVPDRDR